MDHPTVDAIANAFRLKIDGIVGHTFFARFRTTVDYEKKELTFVPNGYRPGDLMESMTKALMAGGKDGPPKTLAPAALWGVVVGKDTDDEEEGVTVREVLAGSAAAEAGLKAGDRLLTVDGRWTDSILDTYLAVGSVKPGKTVVAQVRRGKSAVDLKVTPRRGL
jgi:predicted metalloprotease with PDZ domain